MTNSREKNRSNTQTPTAVPLAIVGIGCLFPGASNVQQYWKNIREGLDAISDIPASHWNPDDYYNADKNAPDMTYARRGGFIDPVAFDPLLYGLSPNNIEATDTTQLLGMVVARQALLDAGYSTSSDNSDGRAFDRSRTSVILGVTGTLELVIPLGARLGHPHWRRALADAGVADDVAEEVVQRIADSYVPWQENSFPGLLGNVAAGRIANRFDLGGTNCVVDAACASSLSAIHMAALELYSGRSDMAISGGFDTFNDIFMYMCFSKTPALSPTGNSRPFDINGDGTILGEGLGAVILKRLDDATRDGDRIYAVIKGLGSSSDGRGNAIYAPSANGQTRALKNAYRDADITPRTVELVEAHGTGTRVGDAVEAEALSSVFREDREAGTWCALGSVKSMIGHTKAAAGVAGLIKIAMALKHKVLPPTIKIERPLEILNPGRAPVYVNTHKRPWIAGPDHPRRAAISAFGFGGSNFHCVLEEAEPVKPQIEWDGEVLIFAYSGKSVRALQEKLDTLKSGAEGELLRYQAATSLKTFNYRDTCRLLLVVTPDTDLQRLIQNVRSQLAGNESPSWKLAEGAYFGRGKQTGKLAMLFPGQGSQYPGMLLDLACQFPQMQETLSAANNCYRETVTDQRLSDLIYPIPVFTDAERQRDTDKLRSTEVAQPAIGAVSIGAHDILAHFGIKPDISAGHSFGELTALCASGRFDTESLLRLAIKRAELMNNDSHDEHGSMLAVSASAAVLHEILEAEQLDLIIANNNAPKQVVLSGATGQIDRAIKVLEKRGLGTRTLPVSAAFHSSFVADAEKPFARFLNEIRIKPASYPVFANSTAEVYPADAAGVRALLASQLARPVEFVSQIENMYAEGINTFIEVGPGSVLTGLVKSILGDRDFTAMALDASRGKNPGQHDLACCLAQVIALGFKSSISLWDAGFADQYEQRPKDRAAMTVTLSGANYVKPRPPKEPVKRPVAGTRPAARGIELNPAPPKTAVGQFDTRPAVSGADDPSKQVRSTQQAIIALQKMQEQTAELHRQYLEGQLAAQHAIQKFIEQQHLSPGHIEPASTPLPVEKPGSTGSLSRPGPVPSRVARKPATASQAPGLESLLLEVVSEKTGYPMDMLSMEMSLDTDLGIDSIKRVEILSALHEKLPGAGKIQPEDLGTFRLLKHIADFLVANTDDYSGDISAPAGTTGQDRPGQAAFETVLFDVISEKTGYPVDMLRLEMNLDTDLGIDSIKRVEILSAFQDRMPGATAINPDDLARLQTLQQILDLMPSSTPVPVVPDQTEISPDRDNQALVGTLLEVVAEKTGYPVDMLRLEMNLDTDLGIDSIKRVEILSAFQERVPDAPAINPDDLAILQTLQQIIDHMQVPGLPGASLSETVSRPDSSTENAGGAGFTRLLLEVVAEKTGYPVDMLRLEMNLDTDLGIDSIKRVEILSAFQERVPDATPINPDDLARLATLQQIVEHMTEKPADPATSTADRETSATGQAAANIWRGVLDLVAMDQGRERIGFPEGSLIGVTDDGGQLAGQLCQALETEGLNTRRLSLTDRQVCGLAGLVIIVPEQFPDSFIGDAFELIQQHATSLQDTNRGPGLLACITGLGGDFAIKTPPEVDPRCAAVAGLVKTADKEWTNVNCQCIDIDYKVSGEPEFANLLAAELVLAGPLERGILDQRCYQLELQAEPLPDLAIAAERQLGRGETVVISGGARGITAAAAQELAKTWGVNLLLIGRSPVPEAEPAWLAPLRDAASIKRAILEQADQPLSPRQVEATFKSLMANREILENLRSIESQGVRLNYMSVDIRDKAAVNRAIDHARHELGPVTGVVHGAGVLADKLIIDKTRTQFDEVYSTKVEGLAALLDATRKDDLKMLVLFSSSTARYGRKGQCDYAAANETLNKLARLESAKRPDCRVLSLNWGPWDGGMVTPQLRKLFESEGVGVIPLEAGSRQLARELATRGEVEVVILGSEPPATVRRMYGGQPIRRPAHVEKFERYVAFERQINLEDFPVLNSHILNGKAVLPVALIMEWFTHGAMHNNPGLIIKGIRDFRVFKGVLLESADQVDLQILATDTREHAEDLELEVELVSGKVLHAGARVILGNHYDSNVPVMVNGLSGEYSRAADTIYEDGRLFHGQLLHGIKSVNSCSEQGISGIARPAPHPSKWMRHPIRTGWITDPLVIDTAFQLMILWGFENLGAGSLPTGVGHYRQFVRHFPKDETLINLRVESTSEHELSATIEFLTNSGQLVARIEGYKCVVDASLNDAFRHNQLAGETQ